MPRVPTTKEVVRGALVKIVLKADQPTGRTVSGSVADLLTRGNHPRGIKVRLTDGRVGRVQSMANGTQPAPTRLDMRYRDIRYDEEPEAPSEQIGLDAYLAKPKLNKKGGGGRAVPTDERQEQARSEAAGVITCPVCGGFDGDEAAVAHHVAGHFGE